MSWIALTTADVLNDFTPAEQRTLENIQGATGNLANIVGDVAEEFRQAITDSGVSLGSTTAGTIPRGFRAQAVALARWRWLISIPQAKAMQTAERKEAADETKTLLKDIASGTRKVAAPDGDTGGVPGPSFGTRGGTATNDPAEREFTREKQEGQ